MNSTAPTEWILEEGKPVALIVRSMFSPGETTFATTPDLPLQIGFVVYGAGQRVHPHDHLPIERHLTGTPEVILVRKGRAHVDFYGQDRKRLATRELQSNDIVFVFGCGHGFRMSEDTTLLEIKQGPYTGLVEKERFEDDSCE
jgi:mannose-6-phosphate isomerase-like protein (cupin superfamily)